jgi:hypothetical protein
MITNAVIVLMNLAVDVQTGCNNQAVVQPLNKRIATSGKIIISA